MPRSAVFMYVTVLGARGVPCQEQLYLFMLQDWALGVLHAKNICIYLCYRIGRKGCSMPRTPVFIYVTGLGARGAPCQEHLYLFMLRDWAQGVFHAKNTCIYVCYSIGC